VALERTCARPPTPQVAWIHQIHAAGGASGSNTMVMLFVDDPAHDRTRDCVRATRYCGRLIEHAT
jgi:hypothetical protein